MKTIEDIFDKILDSGIVETTFDFLEKILRKRDKLKSWQEMINVINEEAKKLGLDPNKIKLGTMSPTQEMTFSLKLRDLYIICLDSIGSRNKSTIRHELYHIYKGDCDSGRSRRVDPLFYWLVAEPCAIAYAHFGMRF